MHVDADISLGTFSGTWRDSAGGSGAFVLTPGAGSGGTARPLPSAVPTSIVLRPDGGFVAGGTLGQGTIPASGPGARMMWYPGKAAFRTGRVVGSEWDDVNIGEGSVALGLSTRALGESDTALGYNTTARGSYSIAMGAGTLASGPVSTAMGDATVASADSSTAMGARSTASGFVSTATGNSTTASGGASLVGGFASSAEGFASLAFGDEVRAVGRGSVALGTRAAAAAAGSFAFGDRSSQTQFTVSQPNQFKVRAAGGVEFFSNPQANIGVRLVAGGVQWTSLSDVNAKHHFRDLDGEDVLTKFAAMPVREWSYKAQDATIRHIGPTAQDFHAAFGLGEEPLRIGTLDADGVALAGVKAVEARTRALRDGHDALLGRVAALEQALAEALQLVRALKGGR